MHDCPFCGTPAAPAAEACAQCGIAITWDGPTPSFADPGDTVTLMKLFDPAQQPVVESLLEAAGIPYLVVADGTQDLMGLGRLGGGYNAIFGPPVIRVPKARLAEAHAALAPLEKGEPVTIDTSEFPTED